MCGIVGFVSDDDKNAKLLINGLKALEYRGYDSCGIAMIDTNGQMAMHKAKGKVAVLEKLVGDGLNGRAGIAHTRWATHGEPSTVNAHPHRVDKVTLVHNGIIENSEELKAMLVEEGISFKTQTDSEVACGLLDFLMRSEKDKIKLILKAAEMIKGSYAFAIMFEDEPDKVYAIRQDSPLILGVGQDTYYLASDVSAFLTYTNMVLELEEGEVAVLEKEGIKLYDKSRKIIDRAAKKTALSLQDIRKDGYDTYLLKEIHEQPAVIKKTLQHFMSGKLEDLNTNIPSLEKYDNFIFVGCGSALHACMIAKILMERYTRVPSSARYASEFRYENPIMTDKTLCVLVSQSGETADTLAAMKLANKRGVDTLAIVNVMGSSLAKGAKYTLYTLAGKEISVATTKAYSAQVALLSLLVIKKAMEMEKLSKEEKEDIIKQLIKLPGLISEYLKSANVERFASLVQNTDSAFFIGRGLDYCLSVEGSLKLKEISYINAQAYPAGELKHGTISLIENATPVIAMITDENFKDKTLSNMKEVKTRGAVVLLMIREDLYDEGIEADEVILLPKVKDLVQAILSVIPYQLLAYHIGKARGVDIDQPRNLAKSVTVE